MEKELLHKELTEVIIKCFYEVYNVLGYGFLEKVYKNALLIELRSHGLNCTSEGRVNVMYKGHIVGSYNADITVNNIVVIEVKTCETMCKGHESQLINYLRSTDKEVGLLLNFGIRPEFKRKVFTNIKI